MLNRTFPKVIDNRFSGHWVGLWIFAVVAFLKGAQALASIVNARKAATGADGIPLEKFWAEASQVVLSIFVLLSFYELVLPILSAIALIRYRAMVPLLFVMWLFVQIGSRVFVLADPGFWSKPVPIGFYINAAILGLTLVGFFLSLMRRADSSAGK